MNWLQDDALLAKEMWNMLLGKMDSILMRILYVFIAYQLLQESGFPLSAAKQQVEGDKSSVFKLGGGGGGGGGGI